MMKFCVVTEKHGEILPSNSKIFELDWTGWNPFQNMVKLPEVINFLHKLEDDSVAHNIYKIEHTERGERR